MLELETTRPINLPVIIGMSIKRGSTELLLINVCGFQAHVWQSEA